MTYRHEVKHTITPSERMAVCASLRAIAQPDPYALPDGTTCIHSLYFDNLYDLALRQKINGVFHREKFRIRYYNRNTGFLKLEKKCKDGDLGYKITCEITTEEVQRILNSDTLWMASCNRGLLRELYARMQTQCLRPKVAVHYRRVPFVYPVGNVRVGLDDQIRAGCQVRDFLNPNAVTVPIAEDATILEVKWDEYLPDIIRKAVQLKDRPSGAFSKYLACRQLIS